MAHLTNYTRTAIAGVLSHNGRTPEDEVTRKNDNIHAEKTPLNYVVGRDGNVYDIEQVKRARDVLRKAIFKRIKKTNEVRKAKGRAKLRKDAAVVGSWVVPLPADWPEDVEEQEFFKGVIAFMLDRYGYGLTYGFVHMDETHPHMHVPVVPLDEDGCINKQAIFNRSDLRTFHDDLQEYMDEQLGYHVTVRLDEDDLVGRAESRLSEDEKFALNADTEATIEDRVEEEVYLERREMRSKAQKLDERENYLKGVEESLNERLMAVEEREHAVTDAEEANDQRSRELDEREARLDERSDACTHVEKGVLKNLKVYAGLLTALRTQVKNLLKQLFDGVEQLEKAQLEELRRQGRIIEEQVDELEPKVEDLQEKASKVTVEWDESYADWFDDEPREEESTDTHDF